MKSGQCAIDNSDDSIKPTGSTISSLRENAELWYRIRVLIHDLGNIGKDSNSEKRLSITTHELYISPPYFSESEAIDVRTTLVDHTAEVEGSSSFEHTSPSADKATLEEFIHNRLVNFFDKRKASGDSRPCGPHDMAPVYVSVFGISKEEMKDERFLSRLRRSGLGDSKLQKDSEACGQRGGFGKGQKKGGKSK